MHVDASDIYPSALVFYTQHLVNITIYRTVYLHTDMRLQTLTHIQYLFNVTFLFLSTLTIGVLHTSDFYMYPHAPFPFEIPLLPVSSLKEKSLLPLI
jgi:hypothetical protein